MYGNDRHHAAWLTRVLIINIIVSYISVVWVNIFWFSGCVCDKKIVNEEKHNTMNM